MAGTAKSPIPATPSKSRRRRAGRVALPTQKATANGSSAVDALSKTEASLLLAALRELRKGNTSVRMPAHIAGAAGRIAAELNAIIEREEDNSRKLSRMASVITAVAEGDLSQTMDLQPEGKPLEGQFLRTAKIINSMVLNTIEVNMRTEELLKQSQRLFAEAQEASRSKSAFLSMAAHELRTPLSVVIGYLSMLQDGSLPPDRWQGALRVLVDKARELNSLVNDLLMAARIEGGTVPTEVTTLDLREITRQAIARSEARATLLQGEIVFEEPSVAVVVEADREQLGRIVDNLINNALTYTIGAPWVRIAVTDGEEPRLTVEDHGIGIPSDLRERIFERFFRIDDPIVGPQPGTGLGLYISRELAERHGGSLVLERSEIGAGSTFVLHLPAPVGAEREVAVVSGPGVAAALEQAPAR